PDVREVELESGQVHETDRPQEADEQRQQGEEGLLDPPDHQDGEGPDEDEGEGRALQIAPLHEPGRLVRDDGGARDLRVDGPELGHELLRARALPDVDLGLDLEEEAPVLAHELPPEVGGNVLDGDRPRVQVPLQAVELRHEVPIELRLQIAQRRLRRVAVDG